MQSQFIDEKIKPFIQAMAEKKFNTRKKELNKEENLVTLEFLKGNSGVPSHLVKMMNDF